MGLHLEVVVSEASEVVDVPILVVPANKQLTLGWGSHLAEKVLALAGPKVEAEALSAHPEGIALGEAVLTSAGSMTGFTHLVHAAVLDKYDFNPLFLLRLRERTSEATLRGATRASLALAQEAGLSGLVLTAMGAGIGGMRLSKCVRIMAEETRAFAEANPESCVTRAVLACRTEEDARVAREAVQTRSEQTPVDEAGKGLGFFERYLTVWVILCILAGIGLGKVAPGVATYLDGLAIHVGDAPVVSIPIAICLFMMMFPIMVKIDFAEVVRAGRSVRPVGLTLFVNWAVKPFTMYAISAFFLGTLFLGFIGPEAVDLVKLPFGLDLPVGATHGDGKIVLVDGVKLLEIPLWRSYLAGCILLGVAPCTAMVLVWGYLARGNDGLTLVMVALNSLTMLVLYGVLGGFLLGVGRLPVPWQALLLSIGIYVALPLVAGIATRKILLALKGEEWFKERFLQVLTPITITALLVTLVLLFSFKGETIVANPLTILWIAIPLFIQTVLIFALGYGLAKLLGLSYRNAAPSALIGASNHFEVAIATSAMLFGLSSGAALATVVGVLIEVPLMLMLVRLCQRTKGWFPADEPTQ